MGFQNASRRSNPFPKFWIPRVAAVDFSDGLSSDQKITPVSVVPGNIQVPREPTTFILGGYNL